MIDANISYTLLKDYRQCHRMVYLKHIIKVIPLDRVNHRNYIVGIAADWLFSKWITEEAYEPEWMYKKADAIFLWFAKKKFIKYRSDNDREQLMMKLQASVQQLEACAITMGLPERKLEAQKRVSLTEEGLNFYSKLDLWFPEEHKIIDLKITKDKKYLDPTQLCFYAWMLRKKSEQVDSAEFLSPLMPEYLIECDVSLTAVEEFEEGLWEDVNKMKEGQWDQSSKDCYGCQVMKFCEIETSEYMQNVMRRESAGFSFDVGKVENNG